MKSLFQGRLRKLKFGILALAIMLTCVWQASVSGWIYIARGLGEWQYHFLAYGDDFTIWCFKPASIEKRDNCISLSVWPTQSDKNATPKIYKTVIDMRAGLIKVEGVCGWARDTPDGPYIPPPRPTDVTRVTVSYWTLILPLAVAAGVMLLWKSRIRRADGRFPMVAIQ